MSDFSTILGMVRNNLLQEGVRYRKSATTSVGAADGTTMIDSGLTQFDDEWNNMVCKLLSGVASGQKRTVEDFDQGTTKLLFTNNAWGIQVASGVEYELYEPGIWDGDELKQFIENAARTLLRIAPEELLRNVALEQNITSTTGVADLPANVIRFIEPIFIGGTPAVIIPANQTHQFLHDAYLPSSNPSTYLAYFTGRDSSSDQVGQLKHIPQTSVAIVLNTIPYPSFDSDGAWGIDEMLWEPIAFGATKLALAAHERLDLSEFWEKEMLKYVRS